MQFDQLKRREVVTLLGGAAAWPIVARAQQGERMRRIGLLTADTENNPESKTQLAAFRQELERLGWSEGRNVRIEYRFAANNPDQYQPLAKELVSLQPDVFLAHTTPVAAAFQREIARFRPYSSVSPIRSAQVWSRAWRGRAAISRVSCFMRKASQASGWRCSRRSRRACRVPRSSPIPGGLRTIISCDRPSP